jgi:hypothetical protein
MKREDVKRDEERTKGQQRKSLGLQIEDRKLQIGHGEARSLKFEICNPQFAILNSSPFPTLNLEP